MSSSKHLQELSQEGRELIIESASREVIEYYRKHGFKTKESVKRYLKYGLVEPIVSDKVICGREDHTAPMDFISDVLLGKVEDFIVWANRSGSKTYLAGIIAWTLSSFQNKRETNILGGSSEQSEKAYAAMNSFWDRTNLGGRYLKQDAMITKTKWKNGSSVHILTASSRSVRGPHPQALLVDEIDEIDRDIYEAALQQPQSKFGIESSTGQLSTNHRYGGTMDEAMASAETNPFVELYKWCIWECLEPCVDYECSTCKLSKFCPGKHMKEAQGYYKISDFIKKLYVLSFSTLQVEWFCTKVGRDDMVFGEQFDPDIHVIQCPYDPCKPVWLSMDWGGTNPFTVGVWQEFERGWVRVDEIYMAKTTNQKVIKEAKKRPWWRSIEGAVGDPSRPDLIGEWGEVGINVIGANNAVDEGLEKYKAALAPVLGDPVIYFHHGCRDSIREFGTYLEKNGKPISKDDHTKDDERYFVMWKINQEDDEVEAQIDENPMEDNF